MEADVKVQRVGTWAAHTIYIIVGIDSAGVICNVVPCVVVAGILIVVVVRTVVNGEVQCHHAVTAHSVLLNKRGGIGTGCVLYSMPCIAIACCSAFNSSIAMIDGQVECHHTVTALRVLFNESRCIG